MPDDNVMPPQQAQGSQDAAAQQQLLSSIPQAPSGSGPSAQDILAGIMGGSQSQQAAPAPVQAPTPTPAAPQQSLMGKLLQGALAGLAGGLSAPFGSSDGAALGIQNANQVEAKRQSDLQAAQNQQDKQNQQQFSNQLASNQDQRAGQDQLNQNQMAQLQRATTQLNLLDHATQLANAPAEAKEKYYAGQAALTKQYQAAKAPQVAVLDDGPDYQANVAAFAVSHHMNLHDLVITHVQGEDDAHGKINIFNPIGLVGKQLNVVAKAAGVPAIYNDDTQYTPEQTTQIQNTIQKEAFEAGQAKLKETGENKRAALAHSGGSISPEMVQAAAEGRIAIPKGKEGAALLSAVTAAHPDFDQSKQVAYQKLNSSLSSGDMGKQVNTLNTAIAHLGRMEDNIPDSGNTQFVNEFKNKGLNAMGSDRLSRFNADQEAAVGELSKLYKGGVATQAEVDAFKDKVKASSSPQQLRTTINEFKQLVGGKIGAMENQVNSSKPSTAIKDRSLLTDESRAVMTRSTPIVQRNKTTGATRISHDGGKTWQVQ